VTFLGAWLVKFRASFTVYFETRYLRLEKIDFRGEDYHIRIVLKKDMREARAEPGTVNIISSAFGYVDFFASGTEYLETSCFWNITNTYWKHLLFIAKCARTVTVTCSQKFSIYSCHPSLCVNIARMNQAVELPGLVVQF